MKDENQNNILQDSAVITESNVGRGERTVDYATILRNFLFKSLTFVMSIVLTAQFYYNFMCDQPASKAFGYTLMFVCAVNLLSDLLIDDEETD